MILHTLANWEMYVFECWEQRLAKKNGLHAVPDSAESLKN